MVDNRTIGPVSSFGFKSSDAMANKMSEEKNGQGGEYFAQEMQEEENEQQTQQFQDRSAQLRASLNGLAAANVGAIHFMKAVEERKQEKNQEKEKQQEQEKKKKRKYIPQQQEVEEELLDE